MGPNLPFARSLPEIAPAAILILHNAISNPTQTIRAPPQILTAARRKGPRIVSVGLKAAANRSLAK